MTAQSIELTVDTLIFDAVLEGPGDGPPVLLLHGFPESSHAWRFVQPQLAAAGYRTAAPDLRGYSPRARPAKVADYAMEQLVGDVVGLADELGWETFHVVGHDWGATLAWQTAGRHPERIRSLAAVSTPHPAAFTAAKAAGPSPDGDDQAAKSSYVDSFRAPGAEELFLADDSALFTLLLEGSGLDAESTAYYVARYGTVEAIAGPLGWYRAATPGDAEGLGPITVPTLYIWSTDDVALGRTAAELTAHHVDGPYRFEILEGVSHWIPEAAADELAALLVDHLLSPPPTRPY
jgi:pimeloyl-ACP methyl ester carboxylesterase